MATQHNAYETLYSNMKNKFIIVVDGTEYLLGDYMRMKASRAATQDTEGGRTRAVTAVGSNLPVARRAVQQSAIVLRSFFHYVEDKLEVKTPPVKDRTLRRFPLRTVAATLLSAVMLCTVVLGYGLLNLGQARGEHTTASVSEVELQPMGLTDDTAVQQLLWAEAD